MTASIPGLRYLQAYLDTETHDRLLRHIDGHAWLTSVDHRVQIYGYTYNRAKHAALRVADLPAWADGLGRQLHSDGIMPSVPDQLVVNDYPPGTGIFTHVDQEVFGDTVCSISLLSTCVMEFVAESGDRQERLLEPRSVLVLSGDARWKWRHGIPSRAVDRWQDEDRPRGRRVSLTYRIMPRATANSG